MASVQNNRAPLHLPTLPDVGNEVNVVESTLASGDVVETQTTSYRWPLRISVVILIALAIIWRAVGITNWPTPFHRTLQYESAITTRTIHLHLRGDRTPVEQAWVEGGHWRITSPPVLTSMTALLYLVVGEEPWMAYLLNLFAWLIAGYCLYRAGRHLTGDGVTPLFGLMWFWLHPYGIKLTQSFQPESLLLMGFTCSLWLMTRPNSLQSYRTTILVAVACSLAALVKPGVLILPLVFAFAAHCLTLATLAWKERLARLGLFTLIVAIPSIVYVFTAMKDQIDGRFMPQLLTQSQYYQHAMLQFRTAIGIVPLILGLAGTLVATYRGRYWLLGAFIGYLGYMAVFSWHTASHDYYHAPLMVLVSFGMMELARLVIHAIPLLKINFLNGTPVSAIVLVSVACTLLFIPAIQLKMKSLKQDWQGLWLLDPHIKTLVALERESTRQEIAVERAIGERLGPTADVICMDNTNYGLGIEYNGGVRTVQYWPTTAEDYAYLSQNNRIPYSHETYMNAILTKTKYAYFVVTNMVAFERDNAMGFEDQFLKAYRYRRLPDWDYPQAIIWERLKK